MKKDDHILRDKLASYESNYSSLVLDNVLSKVNEEKDDRNYLLWICLGLIVFGGSLALMQLNSTQNSKKAKLAESKISIAQVSNQIEQNSNAATGNLNQPEESNSTIILPVENDESTTLIEKESKLQPENTSTQEIITQDKKSQETSNDRRPSEYKSISTREVFEQIIEQAENEVTRSNTSYQNKKVVSSIIRIDALSGEIATLDAFKIRELGEPIGCPAFNDKVRSPIYLEAYFSHDLPFRRLSDNSSEPQEAYINLRNESESPTYSFHTGVRVSSNILKNVVVRVGLDYAQITEKFKVTNLESTREVIIRDADGNVISTTVEEGFRDIVKYNKIKSLNIPISLGYQNSIGKLGLSIHGGVAFNLISSHDGIILDNALMPMPRIISSGGNGELAAFKKDIGLGAIASIGIAYPISERMDFLIEPNAKYILNPINQLSYPVNQKMFTTGLLTGLRFKF